MFKRLSRVVAASRQVDSKVMQERTLIRLSRFPPRDPVQSAKDYQVESLKRLARLAGRQSSGDPRA